MHIVNIVVNACAIYPKYQCVALLTLKKKKKKNIRGRCVKAGAFSFYSNIRDSEIKRMKTEKAIGGMKISNLTQMYTTQELL